MVSYRLGAWTHKLPNWTRRELSTHALFLSLSWIGVPRVLVFPLATVGWAGKEPGDLNLKASNARICSRKLWRSASSLRFVQLVVIMSFPKAPLKRFNDPSGAYGERDWGSGVALTPLAPFGSLCQRAIGGDFRSGLGVHSIDSFFFLLKYILSIYNMPGIG